MLKSFLCAALLSFAVVSMAQDHGCNRSNFKCDMSAPANAGCGSENPAAQRCVEKGGCPGTHFSREQMRAFHEQARQRKRLYFIGKMGLNEVDETIFLELFDKYEAAIHRSRETERDARMSVTDGFTDVQYLKVIKIIADEGMKQAQARQDFIENLQKMLKPEQVYRFFKAEGEFNRQLIRDFDGNCKERKK